MQPLKSNADFCGSLPLHLINQVQDYGVLLVFETGGNIIQVSRNIDRLLKAAPADICDTSFRMWFPAEDSAKITAALERGAAKTLLTLQIGGGAGFPATLHMREEYNLLEVELQEASALPFLHHYDGLKSAMNALSGAESVDVLCETVVNSLKASSGFDRIMVYRFDDDWNGTVVAEAAESGLEPFLGLRFPQSDVPKGARDLYLRNPYRLIPDRDYTPVRLYPVVNPLTNTFTDLFDCNLRSVAGVHIEYLKNMGVVSSMSTRILKDGKLWGLISCHHRTAKMPGREECARFELLSDVMSMQLAALETRAVNKQKAALQGSLANFIERLYKSGKLPDALLQEDLLKWLAAGGVVYVNRKTVMNTGVTPDSSAIEPLVYWLQSRHPASLFAAHDLPEQFEEAALFREKGSGLLSIPLRPEENEFLLIFRPEEVEEVSWGGNPAEALQFDPDGKTYHPRSSFRQWKEQVRGRSRRWSTEDLDFAREIKNAVNEFLLQQ